MDLETSGTQSHVDWRRLHALGLPSGSIRALLAILIFATTWGLLVLRPSREVPDYLRDLLFIIMGHYFAARRWSDQGDEPGPPPLYLPRGSVRLILIAGCVAVALVLFQRGQLTTPRENPGVVTLLLVGGFLLGVVLNAVSDALRERGYRPPRLARGSSGTGLARRRLDPGRPGPEPPAPLLPPGADRRDPFPMGPHRPIRPGTRPGGRRRVLLRLEVVAVSHRHQSLIGAGATDLPRRSGGNRPAVHSGRPSFPLVASDGPFARLSSSDSFRRTLTTYGDLPAVQCPYVVATKVPSGRISTPG